MELEDDEHFEPEPRRCKWCHGSGSYCEQGATLAHRCEDCNGTGKVQDEPEEETDDEDPTPWCAYCHAMHSKDCHCGPIAENE